VRRLEIGPGHERLPGFETLDILKGPATDHVGPAQKPPFPDGTFDEVYSSHCIEHVESYEVEATIAEWTRILKVGGSLEVHTVNAVPLMRAMLEWDETGETTHRPGKWRSDLHAYDPYNHAALRIMCYAKKGTGTAYFHRAILTPRYLRRCFERAGLVEIENVAEPRGAKKHRSAPNMGLRGRKV
jgi:predicted SAM-dependent methyltransferase